MKSIYIYYSGLESYGIKVIIEKFVEIASRKNVSCKYIRSLDKVEKNDIVIPYSSNAALDCIHKGLRLDIVLLVDAYTLGELNKVKFYSSKFFFFNYDFFYSIYAYFRSIYEEKIVLTHYKNIMLVSSVDITYLKKMVPESKNFICVPNGVTKVHIMDKIKSNKLRLGILSSWGRVSYEENAWFVATYYKRFIKAHPDVELIVAGRGEYSMSLGKHPQVICIGEVKDLNDFFKNIDIFLAVNPKGCGILNRVLDAFAHKTVVLGYKNALSGFGDMKNAYLVFDDYASFEKGVEKIINNPSFKETLIENAYYQLSEYYDWDKNYNRLIDYILHLIE